MNNQYDYYDRPGIFSAAKTSFNAGGFPLLSRKIVGYIKDMIVSKFLFLKKKRYFTYNHKELQYFYHKYNKTWKSERAIEIPIFMDFLKKSKGKRILEIGNVMNHYFPFNHPVLDKYEKAKGVINKDILDFKSNEKYDSIISISTFEHIGVCDFPEDSKKAIEALIHAKTLLSDNGSMLVSVPVNYNPAIDGLIQKQKISNYRLHCFKKIDYKKNLWVECDYAEIRDLEAVRLYGGLLVLELFKNTKILR